MLEEVVAAAVAVVVVVVVVKPGKNLKSGSGQRG